MPNTFTKPVSDAEVSGLASVAGKLAKTGGTMTGAIVAGAGTYEPSSGWGRNANGPVMAGASGEAVQLLVAGAIKAYANSLGFFAGASTFSGDVSCNGIRIGPGTSDGSDNSFTTFGHASNSRGGGFSCYGNEHVTFPGMVRADVGGTGLFRVYQASSILFQVDGNSGNTSSSFQHSCGGLSSSAPLQLTGTQTNAGAGVTNIFRNSTGSAVLNTPTNEGLSVQANGSGTTSTAVMAGYGIVLLGSQSNYSAGVTSLYRGSLGEARINSSTSGAGLAVDVNNVQQIGLSSLGVLLTAAHSNPGSGAYGAWRESTLSQSVFQGPSGGVATLYGAGAGLGGSSVKCHGETEANRPGCISIRSGGKNYTNTGTWVNFYNLAEGTHNGQFRLYCNGYNNYYVFTINVTTLTELYNGWTVGNVTGSPTSSQIGFRVSGGWIQINVGTALSSTLYFTATYEGIVR